MTRMLILGGQGNLGAQIATLTPDSIILDREHIDATDFPQLRRKISDIAPDFDILINCIAYNDVDGSENKADFANLLNAELPKQLAEITNDLDKILVHYSTAYVFSGKKKSYAEEDVPDPVSVYGASKAEGEKNSLAARENY